MGIFTSGRGAAALAALLASSLAAAAQEERPLGTSKERADTLKVTVTGEAVIDYVHRGREVTAFTDSDSNSVPGGAQNSEDENSFEGFAAVRFDVELNQKVSIVVEVGTKRVDGDPAIATGRGSAFARLGENQSIALALREARVLLREIVVPELRAEVGITTWTFDPRGQGSALAFAPRRSQTIRRNFDSDLIFNTQDDVQNRMIEAAFADELESAGVVLTYAPEGCALDLVVLPAVVEDGPPNTDEALYALDFWYHLDAIGKGSRVGAIVALSSFRTNTVGVLPNDNEHARVWTVGGGADLRILDGALDVYLEGYAQFGRAGRVQATDDEIDAAGRAFRGGVEWRHALGNPIPIFAGFNYTQYSGDSDTDPTDKKADRFSAYEGVNDLMILEDNYFGYDWDSNYTAFKFYGGATLSAAAKDDLELRAIVGITKATEDVFTPTGEDDDLGNEVDIRIRWRLTRQTVIKLDLAFLFGSDLLEEAMRSISHANPEDSTSIYVLGLETRF